MNRIQKSMDEIRASEELKKNTLRYLEEQKGMQRTCAHRHVLRYLAAAACLFLLLVTGGYSVYARPVSYISIDVNPSIELGINRFGSVVSAVAYNEDGEDVLRDLSLKNMPYVQAIDRLLQDADYGKYLTGNALLVFTVISDSPETIMEKLSGEETIRIYRTLTYTSDAACMEEAHQHEMSFGKYRACLELAQYDENITVEDCHGMTMEEIQGRIEHCQGGSEGEESHGTHQEERQESHGHHGGGHL